ncbi:MAG TPA: LysE family translocator [Streptosporangiaceae bacterium]
MIVRPELLATYLVTVLILEIMPGPDMLLTLASGIRGGPGAGFCAAVGCALGEAMHITAAAAGLAALFRTSPLLYDGTRLAGVGYLAWLGIHALRSRGSEVAAPGGASSPRRALSRGMVGNLLNPKMAVFTITFLPQFVEPARGHVIAQFVVLGALFLALEIVIDGTVGLLAGRIGSLLTTRERGRRRLNTLTGSLYLALATMLATTH